MKMLAALAGTILCAVGSFSFAFYANAFSEIAFVVGTCFMAAGGFCTLAYLVSGRKYRLPETVLVEGLTDIIIGFVVNMDYVADNQLTTIFGLWAFICGVIRMSESFAVSRHNPRKWFAVMPLGLIGAIYGAIMLMPILSLNYSALFQASIGFIVTGLSLIVYSMYMVNPAVLSEKGEKARQRAEAKRKMAEERKAKRKALSELSGEEREILLRREEEAKRAIQEAKKILKDKDKQEKHKKKKSGKKANKNAASSNTVQLTTAQVEEINQAAEAAENPQAAQTAESEQTENTVQPEIIESVAAGENAEISENIEAADNIEAAENIQNDIQPEATNPEEIQAQPEDEATADTAAETPAEQAEATEETPQETAAELEPVTPEKRIELEDLILSAAEKDPEEINKEELQKAAEIIVKSSEEAIKPSFIRPENIPSLRKNLIKIEDDEPAEKFENFDHLDLKAKRQIVNLEELESFQPEESQVLGSVELPEVAINAEGGETEQRGEFLLEIDKTETDIDEEASDFKPLTLEELFADKDFDIKPIDRKDMTQTDLHLTQAFNFDWSMLDKKK